METSHHFTLFTALRHSLKNSTEAPSVLSFIFAFFCLFASNVLTSLSFSTVPGFAYISGTLALSLALLIIAGNFAISIGSVLPFQVEEVEAKKI
ncbi:MAG: hypothetical protein KC422_20655 [Trueperaceae bacterium]|nr:hypothetical protein [Trueperaceae bacterium]